MFFFEVVFFGSICCYFCWREGFFCVFLRLVFKKLFFWILGFVIAWFAIFGAR